MLGYVYGDQCQFQYIDVKQAPNPSQCPTQPGQNIELNTNYLKLSSSQDLGVKIATPVGILIGQLFFGWLADVVGRKKMCRSIIRPMCFLVLQLLIVFYRR